MGSVTKLTTMPMSITAFTAVLAIPATVASPVIPALLPRDSTGEIVAEVSMEEAALLARTEWAAVMLEEAAVTTELCRDIGTMGAECHKSAPPSRILHTLTPVGVARQELTNRSVRGLSLANDFRVTYRTFVLRVL
jgi:hypothetical protein